MASDIIEDLIYHLKNVQPIDIDWIIERLTLINRMFDLKFSEEYNEFHKNNDPIDFWMTIKKEA